MDWTESLPLAACLALHAGGVAVALLNRLRLAQPAVVGMRVLLGMFAIAITGLAVQGASNGFTLWAYSAMTLAAMVVSVVVHAPRDEFDPVLSQFAAARR